MERPIIELKNKQYIFKGTIDEAKRFAVEIRDLSETAKLDLSRNLNDWISYIEADYQSYYSLGEHDFDEMGNGALTDCRCGECAQCNWEEE